MIERRARSITMLCALCGILSMLSFWVCTYTAPSYPSCTSIVIYAITPKCLPPILHPRKTRSLPDIREQVIIPSKPTRRLTRTRRSIRRRRRRRSTTPSSKIIITAPPRALRRHMRSRRRGSGCRRLARRARRPRIVAPPCIHVSVVDSRLARLRCRRGRL